MPCVLSGINRDIIYEVLDNLCPLQSTESAFSSKWRFLIDSESVVKFSISLRKPFN